MENEFSSSNQWPAPNQPPNWPPSGASGQPPNWPAPSGTYQSTDQWNQAHPGQLPGGSSNQWPANQGPTYQSTSQGVTANQSSDQWARNPNQFGSSNQWSANQNPSQFGSSNQWSANQNPSQLGSSDDRWRGADGSSNHRSTSSDNRRHAVDGSSKSKDKWHGHKSHACGIYASSEAVITRESSHTVVNVVTTSSDFAVQLPLVLAFVSTAAVVGSTNATLASTAPAPTHAEVGDVVEVCVASDSVKPAYVWYGATLADSALGHYEEVNPGKCRLYRYVAGSVWNRYT